MNPSRKRKLIGIFVVLLLLSSACGFILFALKQNINLFFTPTQLLEATITPQQIIRLGGYVKNNSIKFDSTGQIVEFVVTDRVTEIQVHYQGVLPNLFREGQTVVMTGKLSLLNNIEFKNPITANKSDKTAKHNGNDVIHQPMKTANINRANNDVIHPPMKMANIHRANNDGTRTPLFVASQILAKHDEKYMPASLAKEMKNEKYMSTSLEKMKKENNI